MSRYHTGNVQPALDLEEHHGDAYAKRVVPLFMDPDGDFSNRRQPDWSSQVSVYTTFDLTTTATEVADANTSRKVFIIDVPADAGAAVRWGPDATTSPTKGMQISAGGQGEDSGDGLWTGKWFAASESGTVTVTVLEFI